MPRHPPEVAFTETPDHPLEPRSTMYAADSPASSTSSTSYAGALVSFADDSSHFAVFQVGMDLVAVKLTGWLDGEAVCLPRTGGKLVPAASTVGFLGLWKKHKICDKPIPTRSQLESKPYLRDELSKRRTDRRDLADEIRSRFPAAKSGGRLRFEDFPPEAQS